MSYPKIKADIVSPWYVLQIAYEGLVRGSRGFGYSLSDGDFAKASALQKQAK